MVQKLSTWKKVIMGGWQGVAMCLFGDCLATVNLWSSALQIRFGISSPVFWPSSWKRCIWWLNTLQHFPQDSWRAAGFNTALNGHAGLFASAAMSVTVQHLICSIIDLNLSSGHLVLVLAAPPKWKVASDKKHTVIKGRPFVLSTLCSIAIDFCSF